MKMNNEPTVKSIVLDIYDISQAKKIISIEEGQTGQEISIVDLQYSLYQQVDQLADLLGIDLDEA